MRFTVTLINIQKNKNPNFRWDLKYKERKLILNLLACGHVVSKLDV